jgi:hypothetical protein
MRANGVRVSKGFASVSIGGRNPADPVVPLLGSIPMAPIGNPPEVFIEIDEVPK